MTSNFFFKVLFSFCLIIKIFGIFILSTGTFSADEESTIKTWFSELIKFGSFWELILFKWKPKKGFNSSIELVKFSLQEKAALIL